MRKEGEFLSMGVNGVGPSGLQADCCCGSADTGLTDVTGPE